MGGNGKVLVVDDERDVLEVIAESLQQQGKEILLADGGGEALRIFREEHPPVVVIDYRMPGVDGLALMKAIKRISPQTEILVVTGEADLRSATEAVRQGAFDYLQKPLDLDELGRRIDQALDRYWLVSDKADEHRAIEAQRKVDEALRMVGTLAAGAAHDFNTLLTIIKGCAEFLLEATPAADPRRSDAERIDVTVDRGRRLVRELMVFGDTRPPVAGPVSVADVVEGMLPTVRSLLGDHVVLQVETPRGLWRVRADPEHIEQVVMNLAANARDAIAATGRQPRGGTLTVELANVEVGEPSDTVDLAGPLPGRYVMVAVRDTGCGMTPQVRRRIFEPFFTTKSRGKGIGLGLAAVACIVRLYNGYVTCESEPAQGSTFRVYLPREEKP